jgi:hypothetical protein
VSVDELLAAAGRNGFRITYDELIECVEMNDKNRFSFDATGDLIRANQGHSVEVDLQPEEREPPEVLFHGTVDRFLPSIWAEGLKKGKRHHIHLSKDLDTARRVIAYRGSCGRGGLTRRRTSSSIGPKVCSNRWIVMPRAERNRLEVYWLITIRSLALTSWRPVA